MTFLEKLTGWIKEVWLWLFSRSLVGDAFPMMNLWSPPDFAKAYVVDVKITIDCSSKMSISMKDSKVGVCPLTKEDTKDDLSLAEALSRFLSNMSRKALIPHEQDNREAPPSSAMSIRSDKSCYFIYRIEDESNLYFSKDTYAVKRGKGKNHFTLIYPRRLVKSSNEKYKLVKDNIKGRNAHSKIALFAYSKPKGRRPKGNRNGDSQLEHYAPFNLYLDVVENPADSASAYIPIIVDPDVRFPGGNGGP